MTDSASSEVGMSLAEISTHLNRIVLLLTIQAFEGLAEDSQKERIRLLDSLDMSNSEIARLLGASESTVRKTRSRLRA